MEHKSLFTSKTFWLNAATIALPIVVPAAQSFIGDHPSVSAGLIGVMNIINRLVGQKGPVDVLPRS